MMHFAVTRLSRRRVSPLTLGLSFVVSMLLLASGVQRVKAQPLSVAHPHFVEAYAWLQATPPSDDFCRAKAGIPCYSPQEIQNAYNLTPLLQKGYTGAGQTIVIIESFGSPTIAQDLKVFDADYNLPDPPSLQILSPLGTVDFDPTNKDQLIWAEETTLDVEWAHAMAPGASIAVLTSPVDETQGVQGLPEFLQLERYALQNHLGQIISQSWSTAENTLFTPEGKNVIEDYENFYHDAAKQHVSILSSSGDYGSANVDVDGNLYPSPTVSFPASSPWVTSVGGTYLTADTSGNYQGETAWNDAIGAASGGGVSQYFQEPDYQKLTLSAQNSLLHGFRGVPDVAYNASSRSGILIYFSFLGQPGYHLIGGTSEGAPQWAGLVAVANQIAGRPIGFLNPILYGLGRINKFTNMFHDITSGDNHQGTTPGYSAATGWDPVTGWGTPNAGHLLSWLPLL